jgi:hypothetical protein
MVAEIYVVGSLQVGDLKFLKKNPVPLWNRDKRRILYKTKFYGEANCKCGTKICLPNELG